MSEIIESKVGNPKTSVSRKLAILSQPCNLTFFPTFYFGKSPKTNRKHPKLPYSDSDSRSHYKNDTVLALFALSIIIFLKWLIGFRI